MLLMFKDIAVKSRNDFIAHIKKCIDYDFFFSKHLRSVRVSSKCLAGFGRGVDKRD